MNKKLLILIFILAILGIAYAFMRSQPIEDRNDDVIVTDRYSVTLDDDKPVFTDKSATVRVSLNEQVSAIGVFITPKEIVSDSRCPSGVQCIWAGTVEVKTVLSTQVSHGENVLKLNQPTIFGDYAVTLKEVTPHPKIGEDIADARYRFTFEIQRN